MIDLNTPPVLEVLDTIFAETPASKPNSYLTSCMMDVRRAMHSDSLRVKEARLREAPDLPAWLVGPVTLPPWEAKLLSEVFTSRPVVVVQGGSGCGKSSARYFLTHHCRDLAVGHGRFFPYLLIVIDLQDQPEALKHKYEADSERLKQIEEFLVEFADTLDSELERLTAPDVLESIFRDAFLSERQSEVITRAEKVRLKVGRSFRQQHPEDIVNWATVRSALEVLTNGHDQTVARFLLLLELGHKIWENDGHPLSLIVDNIDPFPEYLQQALIRTFEAISHADRVDPQKSHHFSIVVFARLSTSTRHSGAMDGVAAKRVSFHAPDVADLVFYRLTAFMLAPVTLGSWGKLSTDVQAELLARMWRLWARMVDEEGGFSKLLSGLAGTNGRIAFKLAKGWLTSNRLPSGLSPPAARDFIFIEEAVAAAMMGRVANALARWIEIYPEDGETLGEWLELGIRRILIDYCLIEEGESPDRDNRDIRRAVSAVARSALRKALAQDGATKGMVLAAGSSISRATEVLFAERDVPFRTTDELRGELASILSKLEGQFYSLDKRNAALGVGLSDWIINAILRGFRQDPVEVLSIGELLVNRIEHVIYADQGSAGLSRATGLRPSRWEAKSILVSPESIDRRSALSAINLFSADGTSISPVALNVLALLEESEGGVHAVTLSKRLEEWGYREEHVIAALTDMVHPDRRLVYSAVKDIRDGVATWFQDSSTVVHISAAGSGYLKAVGIEPAYLQWSLLEPDAIRQELGGSEVIEEEIKWAIGRLRLVLKGLKGVWRDERDRIERIQHRLDQDEHEHLGPVVRILMDGLGRFIRDIAGQRRVHEGHATALAVQFIEFGADVLREHRRLYGGVPARWEERWAFADNDFRNLFSVEERVDPYP